MTVLNSLLANELLQMAGADQVMRTQAISGDAKWDSAVDKAHQARLKGIVYLLSDLCHGDSYTPVRISDQSS